MVEGVRDFLSRRSRLLVGLVVAVGIVAVVGGIRLASAATHIGYDVDSLWFIRFYDGGGNLLPWVSTHSETDSVPSHFYDGAGNWYHCVEPFSESYQGGDLKNPVDAVSYYTPKLGQARAEEFVRQLGYCWKWCDANFSGEHRGIVRQLVIWEIEFSFGLKSENYGPGSYNSNHAQVESMIVEFGDTFVDSNVMYSQFMSYYNGLANKGRGTGSVMVPENGAPSQKVATFGVIENGSVKVTKQATNPDGTELASKRFHFRVTFSGSGAPAAEEFDLAAGGSWQKDDIPAGVVVHVDETADGDYSTSRDPANGEVAILAGRGHDSPVVVSFSNERKTGGVTVSKQLDGPQGDHPFSFHLVVKRRDGTVYRTEDFQLVNGAFRTFDSIPSDYSYEVSEATEAHFRLLSFDGSTGRVPVGTNASAVAKNESNAYVTLVKGVTL